MASNWKLDINSEYLGRLFDCESISLRESTSKSFSGKLLAAIELKNKLRSIRPFSEVIEVKTSLPLPGSEEGESCRIYVFEVERNAWQRETFLQSDDINKTRVIWIRSKSCRAIDAKLHVYKEYEKILESSSILIHNAFDENEDLCKLIGVEKLKSLERIVTCLKESVPLVNLKTIVEEAANRALSKRNIRKLCNAVILKDGRRTVGNVQSPSYYCRNPFAVKGFKNQLVENTLDAISESFAREICQDILKHIERAVQMTLKTEFSGLQFEISPELFATFAVVIGTVIFSFIFPLLGIIVAVATMAITVIFSVDVNDAAWRNKVADDIYKTVSEKQSSVIEDILPEIKKMCKATIEDLESVSKQINASRERIAFPDQETMIQEWKKRQVFPDKKNLLKEYPSILNYIAGKKNGKPVIKVFSRKEDSKAEKYFSENCCKSDETELEFHDVSKLSAEDAEMMEQEPTADSSTRKQLQEIIRNEEDELIAKHSNIIGIRVGSVKLSKTDQPCIVVYCLDKTLVPFGEKEIPKLLEGFLVDIREKFFLFGFCNNCQHVDKGCSIGRPDENTAGSVGFLVKSNIPSPQEVGFLTAAHVAIENVSELNNLNVQHFSSNDKKIVHPSYLDVQRNDLIGSVTKAFCGSFENESNATGMDAAFVTFHEPKTKEPPKLHVVNKEDLEANESMFVSKIGRTTDTTVGLLSKTTISFEINNIWFKNCYIVQDHENSFFKEGDSGSGVYLSDREGKPKTALGIAFAYAGKQTYVCDIQKIVEKFDIASY